MTRKKVWTPQAYNIVTDNKTPINVEQGPDKRIIFFGGPNVWNVPQDRDEEDKLEHLYTHQGKSYVMRKLPLVKLRKAPEGSNKPDFWLPDREAIDEHLADTAPMEEAERDLEDEKALESSKKFTLLARKTPKKQAKKAAKKKGGKQS